MTATGRDRPYLDTAFYPEHFFIRVDFELNPSGWAEIKVTKEDITHFLEQMQQEKMMTP